MLKEDNVKTSQANAGFNGKLPNEQKETIKFHIDELSKQLRYCNFEQAKKHIAFLKENSVEKDLYLRKAIGASRLALTYLLEKCETQKAKDFIDLLNQELSIDTKELFSQQVLQTLFQSYSNIVDSSNPDEKFKDLKNVIIFINSYLDEKIKLTEAHFEIIKKNPYIDLCSIYVALKDGIDINDTKKLIDYLFKYGTHWTSSQIREPFKKGVELFGANFMLEYINENKTSLHDKMIDFLDVCTLYDKFKTSIKSKKSFYHNILQQVKRDGSEYTQGTSYHYLNEIARDLISTDIKDVLEKAKKLANTFVEIGELINYFADERKVFASWKDLKKFMKFKNLVDDETIIKDLIRIKENDKELFEYTKVLLFHNDSNVDINAIREFMFSPNEFFSRGDTHANENFRAISPDNYLDHNLSGQELQHAIVSGKLDEIQEIRPMELQFKVMEHSTLEYLRYALGEKSKRIKGKASDPNRIFSQLKNKKIDIINIIKGNVKLTKKDEKTILEILKDDANMAKMINEETAVYRAQIHRKSDPNAALVGDYTVCCMSLGSGKGNIYYFTPNNAIFSLQKKINGEFRTIAQSVVTLDIDTGIIKLEDITKISKEALEKKFFLTCDNIEIAPNFISEINVIEKCYSYFFREYLATYSESICVDDKKIIIGIGYNDTFKNLKTIKNTFIPTSLMGYSDNLQDECIVLNLYEENNEGLSFNEIKRVLSKKLKEEKTSEYTIKDICPSDIIKIAWLEHNVYGELKRGMAEIQNIISAYLIKNTLNDVKGFTFKMMDKAGMLSSYIIAKEDQYADMKEVYIKDFASKENNTFLNGRMITRFLKNYLNQYKNETILPVIKTEFQEGKSYELIANEERLNKFLNHVGLKAKVLVRETGNREEVKFRNISIYIIKSDEDNSKFDEIISTYQEAYNSKQKITSDYYQENYDDEYDQEYYDDYDEDYETYYDDEYDNNDNDDDDL